MTRFMFVFAVLAACVTNPPPQYPQYQQQPQGYQQPPPPPPGGDPNAANQPPLPGQGAPVQPVPPPPPPKEDLPIDPSKPMPPTSLGTDGKLTGAEGATVMVDGRADIFSAGMLKPDPARGGVAPTTITLVPGGGYIVISNVKGKTGCDNSTPAAPPDGGACAGGNTDLQTAGNASGIIDHKHSQFLVGVFLGAKPGKPPKILDFTDGESFPALAPLLGQTFFIGDGLTGAGTGDPQKLKIPAGAVRLYLGYADGFSFQGGPGWYADNTGGVSATVTQFK